MITPLDEGRFELQSYAQTIAERVGGYYRRSGLFPAPAVDLQYRPKETERRYSALHHNGVYTAYEEDIESLSNELSDSYEAEKFANQEHFVILARKLYVGTAIAGTFVHNELDIAGRNGNSSQRALALREFFGNHDDITEAVRMVFCRNPGFTERSFMVDCLTDERAFAINGLRMSLSFLFKSFNDSPYLGINEEQLKVLAQGHMARVYNREGLTLTGISVVLSQDPKVGDQAAFNAMPVWAIAAANPLLDSQVNSVLNIS